MLLLGQNRLCRGRSPLDFLAKLLCLFLELQLLIFLERHVVYMITQAKRTQNKKIAQQIVQTEKDKVIKMLSMMQGSHERDNR